MLRNGQAGSSGGNVDLAINSLTIIELKQCIFITFDCIKAFNNVNVNNFIKYFNISIFLINF